MTPFIGVRISWLMLARKALFARLAASAASVAACSSASVRLRCVTSSAKTTIPTIWFCASFKSETLSSTGKLAPSLRACRTSPV